MNQIVYILKNESMPEYIKIGFTHGDVQERIKQLDRTCTSPCVNPILIYSGIDSFFKM